MIPLFVVEQHHQVLPFWDRISRVTPLDFILTLDHHTDVLSAFSRMEEKPEIDRDSVFEAVDALRHDEHIDWALRAGIMKRSIILSHENFSRPANPAMKVVCPDIWPDTQSILNSVPEAIRAAGSVLETKYLSSALSGEDLRGNYILDIDLDNFLCEKSLEPDDPSFFFMLAQNAKGISVSMERDWQKILRLKGETVTSEDVLQKLKTLLSFLEISESCCIVPERRN